MNDHLGELLSRIRTLLLEPHARQGLQVWEVSEDTAVIAYGAITGAAPRTQQRTPLDLVDLLEGGADAAACALLALRGPLGSMYCGFRVTMPIPPPISTHALLLSFAYSYVSWLFTTFSNVLLQRRHMHHQPTLQRMLLAVGAHGCGGYVLRPLLVAPLSSS